MTKALNNIILQKQILFMYSNNYMFLCDLNIQVLHVDSLGLVLVIFNRRHLKALFKEIQIPTGHFSSPNEASSTKNGVESNQVLRKTAPMGIHNQSSRLPKLLVVPKKA